MSRDLDSRLSPREAGAVLEWEASGRACHAMRDNFWHGVTLLGGMTGCTRQSIVHSLKFSMREAIDTYWGATYSSSKVAESWGPDQEFLGKVIWVR